MEENTAREQAVVEITEHSDYEAYRRYYYFSARRRFAAWFNWIVLFVFIPVAQAYMVYRYWWNPSARIQICLMAVVAAVGIVYLLTAPQRIFRRGRGRDPFVSVASFYEDRLTHVTTRQNDTQSGTTSYDRVIKAYETKDMFYLQDSANHAWSFFPKKFFTDDQTAALRELFARKFGEKFKGMK